MNKDIYRIWAPNDAKWTNWVRPVPFISIGTDFINEVHNYGINDLKYNLEYSSDTAIIVDLPGGESVEEGLAIAKIGYRPIPLYNGPIEQKNSLATTDNYCISEALIWGSTELINIELNKDTNPVFLLDSNRMNRFKMDATIFDNSWDIYHQDMPSYKYFKSSGITKIIVVGEKFNKDLKVILYKFQKEGINIYYTNGYSDPKLYKIRKMKISAI